jgi:rsbT co-antagonist protein RsbR
MDTRTCHHFLQLTRSCELLGARGVLTGIAPTVAHSIVQLGVEMGGVHTYRSMKEALAGHLASRRSRRNGAGR